MLGQSFGRFVVEAPLGRGGMATVWRASDPLLGRPVALKVIAEGLSRSPSARARFRVEANNGRRLDHPGIVPVLDFGERDGQLWIAFTLVNGETLADRIARAPLDPAEAARIVAEAAGALDHAHERGVLHRDVTSRNIMVAGDGRVFVLDFGLSRALDADTFTTSGTLMGTLSFLAPEVARGAKPGAVSDVWGLGIVLYEALTGRLPFRHERTEALIYAILNEPVTPPSAARPGLSPEWDSLVAEVLDRDETKRTPSAAALESALRALIASGAAARLDAGDPRPGTPVRTPAVRDVSRVFLAVFPFEEAAPDAGGERLAPGLGAAIVTALAAFPELTVIEAAGPDADPARPLSDAARSLGANRALRGSVRRSGTSVRVGWRLLDPFSSVQIHAGSVEGLAVDPLGLEDRLVASVIRGLGLEATTSTPRTGRRHDPAAAEHLQQALGYLHRYDHPPSVDGAIELLERLIESDGESAAVLGALGRAYLMKRRLTNERSWEARAASACERALALDAGSEQALLAHAELQLEAGRHPLALEGFERLLAAHPTPEALVGRGRALEGLGRTEEAEATLREAVTSFPDRWSCHQWLGLLHFRQSRYDAATAAWSEALRLSPGNARTLANLGAAHFQAGHLEEAVAACRRSIAAQPNPRAYANLGTALTYLGRHEEAVETFERAVALSPGDPEAWGNLGSAARLAPGREARAREATERAIALMRDRTVERQAQHREKALLAAWLSNIQRYEEASREIERALAESPNDLGLLVAAVGVYQIHDPPRAISFLRRCLEAGYRPERFASDPALARLRAHPLYAAAVAKTTGQNEERSP